MRSATYGRPMSPWPRSDDVPGTATAWRAPHGRGTASSRARLAVAGRRSALASPVTAAILGTLQDAVELDAIRADLLAVVDQVLEPASVSVWMSERG
jgi:hypothetical protein